MIQLLSLTYLTSVCFCTPLVILVLEPSATWLCNQFSFALPSPSKLFTTNNFSTFRLLSLVIKTRHIRASIFPISKVFLFVLILAGIFLLSVIIIKVLCVHWILFYSVLPVINLDIFLQWIRLEFRFLIGFSSCVLKFPHFKIWNCHKLSYSDDCQWTLRSYGPSVEFLYS